MGRLEGKRGLVTGVTSGIGYAIADRFLREGAAVVITGRDQELGRCAEAALRGSGQAGFVAADAGDPDAVARSVDLAVGQLGGLDVLVNNAGIGTEARLLDTPLADYDRVMNVNVRAYFLYAVFYASDETDFITGTTLLVDGGMTTGYHQREHSPRSEPGPSSAPEV